MKVADALAQLHAAAEHLRAEYPEIAGDEELWLSSLESLTDAVDLAAALAERVLHLQALEAAALERARSLQARAKRFENEQNRLRDIVLALVDAAGGRKIVLASLTLSPRNTPPKIVEHDASLTPPEMLLEVVVKKPNRDKIKEALELGADVPGWRRTQGGRSLAILVR